MSQPAMRSLAPSLRRGVLLAATLNVSIQGCDSQTDTPASSPSPPVLIRQSSAKDVVELQEAARPFELFVKRHAGADVKIYRGVKAAPGLYPWMVAFVDSDRQGQPTCGGSLVSAEWVLTAAHCGLRPEQDLALLDRVDLEEKSGGDPARIDAFCRNPQGADLALVHLTKPASQKPIRLSDDPDAQHIAGESMSIFGWGLTEAGRRSRHLLYAEVDVVARDECTRQLADVLEVCADCICGWRRGSIADACTWDSGGPGTLMHSGGREPVQVGVITEGAGCGAAPGVYTFVPRHLDWIEATTAGPPSRAFCGG